MSDKFLGQIFGVIENLTLFNLEGATKSFGGIAQLGEHLLCKQGVISSNLIISTTQGPIAQLVRAHD